MRNRSAIWVFTILLALACLYQLSLSWVTGGVEDKADAYAAGQLAEIEAELGDVVKFGRNEIFVEDGELSDKQKEDIKAYFSSAYIAEHADDPVYPVTGLSYKKCKAQQLTKGLDLQGGMAVTLEISIPDMIKKKAGSYAEKEIFTKVFNPALERFNKGEDADFVELFFQEYDKSDLANGDMNYFYNSSEPDEFPIGMPKADIKAKLQNIASASIKSAETVIEERVNRFGLGQIVIQPEALTGRLHIEIPGAKDKEGIRKMLQSEAKLKFWDGYNENLKFFFDEADKIYNKDEAAAADIVQQDPMDLVTDSLKPYLAVDYVRVDGDSTYYSAAQQELLNAQAIVAENQPEVEEEVTLADAENPGEQTYFGGKFVFTQAQGSNVAFSPGIGYAKSAGDTGAISLAILEANSLNTDDVHFLWSFEKEMVSNTDDPNAPKYYRLYAAVENPNYVISGQDIAKADYGPDPQTKKMQVTLTFHNENNAADNWEKWTGASIGKFVGITLDDIVYSFPVINQAISGGSTSISGNFSFEDAEQLAAILEAGALPAPAKIADESIIGATMSKENIDKGILSFIIALILVLVYMCFYYSKAGIVAGVALLANLFFIMGTLASLGAALTLPGIAGLVLTIGISVDANVLIFERIREELRNGKVLKQAIADGYRNAYSAILDSNITSLLTAIILAYMGSGPIQGFATTLIIGIFSSLFCSIIITRLLFSHMVDAKWNVTFSNSFSEKVFSNASFNFMGGRKKYYFISGAIVIIGIGSLVAKGLDAGVEFTGGREYVVAVDGGNTPNQDEVRDAIAKFSVENVGDKGVVPVIKTVNGESQFSISTNYLHASALDNREATAKVDSVLNLAFNDLGFVLKGGNDDVDGVATYENVSSRSVSAIISKELLTNSFIAIGLSLLVVFLYIGLRFSRWQFGLGALIAMFHDVMVVLGIFSLIYALGVNINVEIDQAFIAAVLTVIGYSINDTVVIYDRIREFIGLRKRDNQDDVINSALNTTLSRTVNTSLTTFMVLLIIYIFGGDGIAGFSLALLIGVAVGTYSSVFIAAPSVVEFTKNLMPVSQPNKKK